MTIAAIRGLGAICASGFDVASAMGAILSNVQLFDDLPTTAPGGEPITGASTRLPRALGGLDRLAALALLALEEAATGVRESVPVIVCAPSVTKVDADRLLDTLAREASVPIERPRCVALASGRSAALEGCRTAAQWLSSGRVPACLVVGVDSLIEPARARDLLARGEILYEGQEEGYIPGEAAAALLLTAWPDRDAGSALVGLGTAQEPGAASDSAPLSGAGFARAAAEALRGGRLEAAQLSALSHECTGSQRQFEELLLARGRGPLDVADQAQLMTASLSVGEVGAAAGIFSIAMMSFMLEQQIVNGPVLCLLRGEGTQRGAVLLAATPKKQGT